jgi:hypothetical protein
MYRKQILNYLLSTKIYSQKKTKIYYIDMLELLSNMNKIHLYPARNMHKRNLYMYGNICIGTISCNASFCSDNSVSQIS